MKSLTKTITMLLVLNLIAAGSALSQEPPQKEADIAQKTAEACPTDKSLGRRVVKKAVEVAQKSAGIAADEANRIPRGVSHCGMQADKALEQARLSLDLALFKHDGAAATILVVPNAEIKPQDLDMLTQDLNIMSRILEKKLNPDQKERPGGSFWGRISGRYMFSDDERATRAIYVQGYGALFLLKVDFPLSPTPEKIIEEEKTEEEIDSVWSQTKRELYTPEEPSKRQKSRSEEKYDAKKVESLKTTLIEALKHAANIRSLKPDESVILTVRGYEPAVAVRTFPSSGAGPDTGVGYGVGIGGYGSMGAYGGGAGGYGGMGAYGGGARVTHKPRVEVDKMGFFSPTVLIIRAKKSDIDAFSKDKLNFDQFRQKAQILTYPYLGE